MQKQSPDEAVIGSGDRLTARPVPALTGVLYTFHSGLRLLVFLFISSGLLLPPVLLICELGEVGLV